MRKIKISISMYLRFEKNKNIVNNANPIINVWDLNSIYYIDIKQRK